jgi:hypothetical protein
MRMTICFVSFSALVAVAALAPASAADSPLTSQLEPLAFLAGQCWSGPFPGGKATDEHCFEWVYDGRFLRDRHIVRGGENPYRGETLYYWDPAEKAIAYIYFNSDGGVSRGNARADGDTLVFPSERHTLEGGAVREYGTTWKREGADRYVAVTSELKDGQWHEAWRVDFRRVGPVSGAEWLE